MRYVFHQFFIALIGVAVCSSSSARADWPQFLGESRNGTSDETGLLDSFPNGGPQVVWRVPGGVGMSAVTVSDEMAITALNEDGRQKLVSFDAKTGKRIWETRISRQFKNGQGDGPRATAAVADGFVYAFSGEGLLCCVNQKTGELKWKTDTIAELKAERSEFGMSASPLVFGDRVILHVGGEKSAVAAFGTGDGQLKWAVGSGPAGYSSPALMTVAGKQQVVSVTGDDVYGIDPNDGTVLWTYPFKTPFACNTANPVMVDGDIFVSAGENHGCALIAVEQSDGKFTATHRWESVDVKSVMRNEWQTSVLLDGYLYGFDNVGAAGPISHLTCIKADTGERVWQKTRFGKANMVLADNKLWITTMDGELVLVNATPKEYQEISRAKLFGKTRQTLSIVNGHGYIRDDQEVLCIKLK